ncbi:MAG: glycosyltransferase family 4 protein [Desulfitobacteriaceae bacterium]
MRVLSLTNEFEEEHFGGAGTAVTGMVHVLAEKGVQQVVVVPRSDGQAPAWIRRGGNLEVLGLPRALPFFGRLGLINATYVLSLFPELSASWDLIHIQAINFAPLAYTLSGDRIPILYSVHSLLRDELDDDGQAELHAQFAIQDDLCHRCQRIHLLSASQRDSLAARFPQYLQKMEVLPLGFSGSFRPWRGESSQDFLYVGRLVPYKGIEDLLKALVLAKKRGRLFHLDVVGKGSDGYMAHLIVLLKTWHLGGQVRFHGWENPQKVRYWLESSGILVIPSQREAYGLVALEGMAAGIPLIVSRAGGLAELLDRSCALTFEAGNVKQLTQAMTEARSNPTLMHSLAQSARLKAAALEWPNLAASYLQLYSRTLDS